MFLSEERRNFKGETRKKKKSAGWADVLTHIYSLHTTYWIIEICTKWGKLPGYFSTNTKYDGWQSHWITIQVKGCGPQGSPVDRQQPTCAVVSQRAQPVKRRHQGEGKNSQQVCPNRQRRCADDNLGSLIRGKIHLQQVFSFQRGKSLRWRGKCFSF